MTEIGWQEFENVDLRVGTILFAEEFSEAIKPAYKLTIDFGDETGVKKSSAQITALYNCEELIGKQVIGVVNLPAKRIGPFISECLVTGFIQSGGDVVLAVPDRLATNGSKLA